ncbi:MAG: flagellar brake protein [Burkholderiales bacterium]|nr:flagellar brake protein [Burkholderiales bacterium]MDE2275947.1 flagellar brake protein [Burkholderiales bacterium]
MFQHTRPAELDPLGGADPWAEFRVGAPAERLRLLRELRDGSVPVILNAPDGAALPSQIWAVDTAQSRLNFSTDGLEGLLPRLIDADEAVAVAYLQSVKLQFDLHGFTLVRGAQASALQCALPSEIYRFQRRSAYRVRPPERHAPTARLRHPALPEMALALRIIDISIGGCALWLPHDVPPLRAGTRLGELAVALDAETRFACPAVLQHVSALGGGDAARGTRLGCEWGALPGSAERVLQRWIDRTQQQRRRLTL